MQYPRANLIERLTKKPSEIYTVKIRQVVASSVFGLVLAINSIGSATAADRTFKQALEECFWGLILTDESQRGLALGLNVVSGALGTYAYTSATLTPDAFCSEKTQRTASFVKESYQNLVEDVSRGDGEFLLTAMELTGCNTIAGRENVTNNLREGLAADLAHQNFSNMQEAEKALRLFTDLSFSAQANCTA